MEGRDHDAFFLVVDEVDGRVYRVPRSSLLAGGGADHRWTTTLDQNGKWVTSFVDAPNDTTCFLNAEAIAWLCNHRKPCLLFRATDGRCVYASHMRVLNRCVSGEGVQEVARRFVWPHSFHFHDEFWGHINSVHPGMDTGFRLVDNGEITVPEIAPIKKGGQAPWSSDCSSEQRPRPFHIEGAERVKNMADAMTAAERGFFLEAITGRFLFRDASESIENYVRHTKRKKETHPERVLFNSRILQHKQVQRIRHCNEMKRRAVEDPALLHDVKRRALQGMKFLESLNVQPATPSGVHVKEPSVESNDGCRCFYDLGTDPVSSVLEFAVMQILKDHNPKRAAASFRTLQLVDSTFRSHTLEVATRLLQRAKETLNQFATMGSVSHAHGVLGRQPADFPWKTYKHFACSPRLLMSLLCSRQQIAKHYFVKRMESKLDQNVSLARAHARGAWSTSCCDECEDSDHSCRHVAKKAAKTTSALPNCASFEVLNPSDRALPLRVLQLFDIAAGR